MRVVCTAAAIASSAAAPPGERGEVDVDRLGDDERCPLARLATVKRDAVGVRSGSKVNVPIWPW